MYCTQWRSEGVRGPWTTDSLGPTPPHFTTLSLWPPHRPTPCSDFWHVYLYRQIWLYTALFNQLLSHRLYSLYGVFWKFGSLSWSDREMGALWWCNDKLGPLYNVIGNSRSQWGSLDDEMHKMGLLTTWWEIILMAWWGKLGALDSVIENFGPFDDAMGKLETLDEAMRKLLNDLMGKTGNWALDSAMEHLGALWWRNGKIRDPSNEEILAPWRPDGKIGA